jgi:hypothetical protein
VDLIEKKLTKKQIDNLYKKYGDYFKLTVDVGSGRVIAGCVLHADGEKILLEKGSLQNDIWGGGINLRDKQVDTLAVMNIRPNLMNDNLEILDKEIRDEFIKIVNKYFNI